MTKPAILVLAFLLGCGSKPAGEKVAEPLDPEAYRPHLVLLDAIIFEDVQLASESQLMLAESVGRLARDLVLEGDHPETARLFSTELDDLMARVQGGAGKDMESSGIRDEWLRVRDKFFADAGWFRNSSEDPVGEALHPRMGDQGQVLRDVPGMDTLAEVLSTLFIIANAAERDLGREVEATPGKAKMLALLTTQLARVDSLLAARTEFHRDLNFQSAWTRAKEASRQIRIFIASDADTMPGSPGRAALEEAITQLSEGMDEMEKVGS